MYPMCSFIWGKLTCVDHMWKTRGDPFIVQDTFWQNMPVICINNLDCLWSNVKSKNLQTYLVLTRVVVAICKSVRDWHISGDGNDMFVGLAEHSSSCSRGLLQRLSHGALQWIKTFLLFIWLSRRMYCQSSLLPSFSEAVLSVLALK